MGRWPRITLGAALAVAVVVGCGDDEPTESSTGDSVTETTESTETTGTTETTETTESTGTTEPGTTATVDEEGPLDGVTLEATITVSPEGLDLVVTVTNDASEPVLVVDRLTTPEDTDLRYIDDGDGAVRLLRALAGPTPGTAYERQPTAEAIRLAPGESLERTSSHRLPTDPDAGPWLGEPAAEATTVAICVGAFPDDAYPDAAAVDGPDGPVVTLPDLVDGPVQTLLCSEPVDL